MTRPGVKPPVAAAVKAPLLGWLLDATLFDGSQDVIDRAQNEQTSLSIEGFASDGAAASDTPASAVRTGTETARDLAPKDRAVGDPVLALKDDAEVGD